MVQRHTTKDVHDLQQVQTVATMKTISAQARRDGRGARFWKNVLLQVTALLLLPSRDQSTVWTCDRAAEGPGRGLPPPFTIDMYSDNEMMRLTRFRVQEVVHLYEALQLPETMRTYRREKYHGLEATIIFLHRMRSAESWDLINRNLGGGNVPGLVRVFWDVVSFIYSKYAWVVTDVSRWERYLVRWAEILSDCDACEEGIIGFIDGTARRTCRPTLLEHLLYNGYYKFHGLKFVRPRAAVQPGLCSRLLFHSPPLTRPPPLSLACAARSCRNCWACD